MRKYIIGPIFILASLGASSCSVFVQNVASDVLYIRNWTEQRVDFNPGGSYNFIPVPQTAVNALGKRINPAAEPAIEFATAVGRDGSLYLAYATAVNSSQTITVDTTEVATTSRVSNIYTETLEGLASTRNLTVYRDFTRTVSGTITTHSLFDVSTNELAPILKAAESGVWVRLLRYDPANSTTPWSVVFATPRPAPLSGLKIAFIPGRTQPYVAAVSNGNRLVVFGRPSADESISFIQNPSGTSDLNGGRNPGAVSQLSIFTDGGGADQRLYISFIEDNRSVIGYVRGLVWQENYAYPWEGRTPNVFSMASSAGTTYGVWWDSISQLSTVSAYFTNAGISRRWSLVNRLSATEAPRIKSRQYLDGTAEKLDIYIGYIYNTTKFFQLSLISNNQVYTSAPPIDGYNTRFDFDIDSSGRILYIRANSGNTLDVGAWTRSVWVTADQPKQIIPGLNTGSTRQPFKVFPSSEVAAVFVQGVRPFVLFIEEAGYLQMLEGVRGQP